MPRHRLILSRMSNETKNKNVGALLKSFSNCVADEVKGRKYFYKSSKLVKEGVIMLHGSANESVVALDLVDNVVELDRRMLDFIVGLDTEFSEIVDGSNLYTPNVNFDDVILPDGVKESVLEAVSSYEKVREAIVELEVDKAITYGRGQCILFHGASGTGNIYI